MSIDIKFSLSLSLNCKINTSVSPLVIQGPRVQWYRPITLKQLFTLKNRFSGHTENKVVAGNTSMGMWIWQIANVNIFLNLVLELRQKGTLCPILISVTHIPELQILELNERGLVVGAAVTVAQLEDKLKEIVNTLPGNIDSKLVHYLSGIV